MTGDSEFTEGDLIKMLAGLIELRHLRDMHARAYETAKAPVAEYLRKHGGSILDGEHGIRASLQDKKGSPECDLMTMAETESHLVLWLAVHGMLKLDHKAWMALDGKARETMRIKDFLSPGAGSQSLIIVKEDR